MPEVPLEIVDRRDTYCETHEVVLESEQPRGWGVDGYVWQTTDDTILKVHYNPREFAQELAIYDRLTEKQIDRLQGFDIPLLLNSDTNLLVLEMSYVRPPFVLDFAAAELDEQPLDFNPESPGWQAEKQQHYGDRWPEVVRLLDALRHLGIHYTDVHPRNICIDAPPEMRGDASDKK